MIARSPKAVTQMTEFLTVREVAEQLKVWRETVRVWLQQGKLRGFKLPGGDWRIRPEDVDAMLQAGTGDER